MNKDQIKKVVLAYSGGLDTSIIIPWLKENYNNCEVIAVSGNVGQADELDGLEEKAIKTGASKLYVLDLTDDYVDNYIIPTMKAGALYEEYLLGTSHARPCIAKALVDIAIQEGADAICHGCTGKGNDQVRFELTIKRFAPNISSQSTKSASFSTFNARSVMSSRFPMGVGTTTSRIGYRWGLSFDRLPSVRSRLMARSLSWRTRSRERSVQALISSKVYSRLVWKP